MGETNSFLAKYVTRQLENFFPDDQEGLLSVIVAATPLAVERVRHCCAKVRPWHGADFDYMHSAQFCIYLWYLSNVVYLNFNDKKVATKIFLLNKAVNGFDCFYDNHLPEVLFIGHTVGIVLVRNEYKNYLVLYQNSTIGRIGNKNPSLSERLILYPNTAIIGDCQVGKGVVLSQGSSVINQSIEASSYVFGTGRNLTIKPFAADKDPFEEYFL